MTLHHVALEVRREDADAEVAFWRLLGFGEVRPPAALGERSRWVQHGGTQVHLLFADAPTAPVEGHVAVVAEDYAETQARLRDAGFEVRDRGEHWGSPRCFTRTPGGHRVEVMAAPPA